VSAFGQQLDAWGLEMLPQQQPSRLEIEPHVGHAGEARAICWTRNNATRKQVKKRPASSGLRVSLRFLKGSASSMEHSAGRPAENFSRLSPFRA